MAGLGPSDGADGADGAAGTRASTAREGDRGSQALRSIGISPYLDRNVFEIFDGNQWPPVSPPLNRDKVPALPGEDLLPLDEIFGKAPITGFPRRAWTTYHYSIVVLGEFVQQQTEDGRFWHELAIGPVPDENQLHNEIDELIELIEYRPGVLNESLTQGNGLLDYFRGVLSFSRNSHRHTYELAHIALRVAQFAAMHFKHQYRIPRPSYLAPALMPPIDPPGHASWPSGHATEAYLLALCLKDVLPQAAFNPERPHVSPLDRLAERIARNREVLGVHYPCDSRAGRELAEAIFPLLMKCPSLQGVNDESGVLQLARDEWKITPVGP